MGTALGTEAADLLSVIDQILSKNREDLKDQQEILAHLTSRRPVWERRVSKVWWNVMVAVMKTILRTRPLDENGMKRGLSVMSKHHRHHHSSREAHSMQFWALRESEAVLLEAKHEEIERERLLSEAEACSARLETAEASARAVASRLDRELEQLNQEASALRLTMHEGQQGQPDQVPVGQSGWTQRREDAAAHQQRNRGQSRRQAETWTTYSEPRRKDAHVWLPRFSTSMAGGPARYYIESEADAASHTNALKGRILGLDLEGMLGRPRDPGPVPTHMRTPLLQLCDGNTILIFQLDKIGSFPSGVKQLIESEDVYKVGVAIKNDLAYLRRDFRVNARAYVDLSDLAKWVAPSDWTTKRSRNEMIGLADLCRCYLGQHLQKSKVTRSSNWRGCLSYEQLAYACDDVFCSYKVGVHLNEHGSPGMGNIRRFAEGLPPEAAGEDEDGSDSDLGYRCIGAS
ncbi:ribonuclease H-like protein [Calocera cornea HHB12733]|uniref:3'-5' exonuclease n=1 Tax=Calocera cornea HHB12733 TaxID=1353952 RepID=A0A165CG39_9BASI|nr:ribonuclease H-like protein [Calocera cornea HHB12733]